LPADTQGNLAEFAELLGMAIANAASRTELTRLAEEQAALRRVATEVARGAAPEEVFAAVVEEVGRQLPVDFADLGRYEPGGRITFVAAWGGLGADSPVGSRWKLEGRNLSAIVFGTRRPARINSYADASGPLGVRARERGFRSAVGTPIIVEGGLWGIVVAGSGSEKPMPADTEARLADFTELLATAVANAESRSRRARLAAEQAALRRVATLVARGSPTDALFAAIVDEVGQLLPVDIAGMGRYEPDGTVEVVASWNLAVDHFPVGCRPRLGGHNLVTIVFETGRPARMDDYAYASGPFGVGAVATGFRSAVGTPIVVEGKLWGVMIAGSSNDQPLPSDTEARLADFTGLLATAIANANSRADLAASRARIVAAGDEARRRIERDLHDRAQQKLVALGLQVRAAQAALPPQLDDLERELSLIAEGLASVFEELREISHGVHPAILSNGGLEPALKALARRSAVPVELDLSAQRRLPEQIEVAAYYVASEALTNAAKHARASVVHVVLEVGDTTLRLVIDDDGIGGADPTLGSGLLGLSDRVEALGGTLKVTSPARYGTTLEIEIPVGGRRMAGSSEP
jgi:signal transduction histidine kinase